MIDSTKSPAPAWKRYATIALLAILVVVAAYVIYTKELHKSSANSSASRPPATAPVVAPSKAAVPSKSAVTTTIPGGIAPSTRDPFGS